MDRVQNLIELFTEAWKEGKDVTVHTSGSTGMPKDILLTHHQMVRSARRTNKFFGIGQNSHLHSVISFEYIGGKMMIARSIEAGCRLTWQEPSLRPSAPASDTSLMSVVPAQMSSILEHENKFKGVNTFLIGGSSVTAELWPRISNSGVRAYESYGMTETASHIALRRVKGNDPSNSPFRPLEGVELSLAVDGCLIIKDEDIELKTNDIVTFTQDGGFFILGRKDDMIVTGGKKVLPQTIEKILAAHIDFKGKKFIIDSRPHPVWSNEIVLKVESDNNSNDLSSLQSSIDKIPLSVFPRWQRPKEIIGVENIPLSASGKPLRRLL